MPPRQEVEIALKRDFVPKLRELGFTGSFPIFAEFVENSSTCYRIQFAQSGGRFCVELGRAKASGIDTPWGEHIPAAKMTKKHADATARLGPHSTRGDYWYTFGPRSYEDESASGVVGPAQIVAILVSAVREHAVPWWEG